jgi:hypothetical protein
MSSAAPDAVHEKHTVYWPKLKNDAKKDDRLKN